MSIYIFRIIYYCYFIDIFFKIIDSMLYLFIISLIEYLFIAKW